MPRGEKATNPSVKPHRARKIAEGMMRRGATRKAANEVAHAAMDREYAPKRSGNPRRAKHAFDEEAHDSRTGQRKTNLTTKRGAAVSGASKPGIAKKPPSNKRDTKATGRGGAAASGRRPRAAASLGVRASQRQSTAGKRPPRPR
ncbi:MAG TPA: hypothetical protein VED01_13515 [Burkholderiales bacterium]|nr:hypothetical protein [Burkholderiales bacterium]